MCYTLCRTSVHLIAGHDDMRTGLITIDWTCHM